MDRRGFVAAVAGVGATAGFGGCLRAGGVNVLSAGSLAVAFDENVGPSFKEETGTAYSGEYYGSNAVMRMVEDGQKSPDVVVSADVPLLRDRLYDGHADWDAVFASNSVGIAYGRDTEVGDRLESGDAWYEVLRDADEGEVAISDPDLDPLGYRAVLAFKLAEEKHGISGFADEMLSKVYEEPQEPQLLAGVRSGTRDAAVVYRNMAIDHDLPFHELPDDVNFSDPDRAEEYAEVSYTTDEGYEARGTPVLYNVTVLTDADSWDDGVAFVNYLLENRGILADVGLSLPEVRYHGDVPEEVGV
jgi:molybdate/tungstate transport system substrate-binding protein